MKFIPIICLRIPDEVYSNLLTEDTLMKFIPIICLRIPDEVYSNLLTEDT